MVSVVLGPMNKIASIRIETLTNCTSKTALLQVDDLLVDPEPHKGAQLLAFVLSE